MKTSINLTNSINSLKAKALMVILVILFAGAHWYSNGKGNNNSGNEQPVKINPVLNVETVPYKAVTKKLPIEVKNIWHRMPSFDKYGNEITPRARFNMMQNKITNKNK